MVLNALSIFDFKLGKSVAFELSKRDRVSVIVDDSSQGNVSSRVQIFLLNFK